MKNQADQDRLNRSKDGDFFDREAWFSGAYSKEVFESLWWAWSEWKGVLFVILLCGFLGRSIFLSNSIIVGMWADSLCQGSASCKSLPWPFSEYGPLEFVINLIIFLVLGTSLTLAFTALTSATGTKVAERYHNETMLRVSRAPQLFFDRNPVGRIFARFSTDFQQLLMATGPHLGQFMLIILDLSLMALFIVLTNIYFIPVLAVSVVLNYLLYRANKMNIREQRRLSAAQRAPSIAKYSETVQGYLSIRLYGKEHRFISVFKETVDRYLKQKARADFTFHLFGFQMSSLTALLVLSTGFLGIWLISRGHSSVGQVGVVLTYVTLSSNFIQRLFTLITSVENGLAGAERLNEYLRQPIEPYAALPEEARYPTQHLRRPRDLPGKILVDRLGKALVVENLWFRYTDEGPWILKGLDFTVKPGESVGVIGRTGAGKSSLFQALLQVYPPAKGRIAVGGMEVGKLPDLAENQVDLEEWRRQFSYITQSPTIFRGLLRDNLDPFGEKTDDQILEILEKVGLGDFVASLPKGLLYGLEESGANLSAGQRQLIATARCLLSDAGVVLMDEATSAIDPNSEEAFVRATTELLAGRTRLIIAHRLSTVLDCDRLLWIHQGKAELLGPTKDVLRAFRGQDHPFNKTAGAAVTI